MRFRIQHPKDANIYAEAGVDHALASFFVEVFREGRARPIACLDPFKTGRTVTLAECLDLLIARDFFRREQLEDALAYLQGGAPAPKNMRVVEIVSAFKRDC